jgi:hypothetical protein
MLPDYKQREVRQSQYLDMPSPWNTLSFGDVMPCSLVDRCKVSEVEQKCENSYCLCGLLHGTYGWMWQLKTQVRTHKFKLYVPPRSAVRTPTRTEVTWETSNFTLLQISIMF